MVKQVARVVSCLADRKGPFAVFDLPAGQINKQARTGIDKFNMILHKISFVKTST